MTLAYFDALFALTYAAYGVLYNSFKSSDYNAHFRQSKMHRNASFHNDIIFRLFCPVKTVNWQYDVEPSSGEQGRVKQSQ